MKHSVRISQFFFTLFWNVISPLLRCSFLFYNIQTINIFLQRVDIFLYHFLEPLTALSNHGGHIFHEVFQLRQGRYSDIPAAKISEMMKSNSLDVNSWNQLIWFNWYTFLLLVLLWGLLSGSFCIFFLASFSSAECPDSITFECCEWDIGWKHWKEKWWNTSGMLVKENMGYLILGLVCGIYMILINFVYTYFFFFFFKNVSSC